MRLIKNIIKTFFPDITDEPKAKPFATKLFEAIDRAEKARKSILHSDLPEKDRLQIADEILYLIDDLRELQTIKLSEEGRIWEAAQFANHQPFGLF
jgi:hypothetical protein